MHIEHGGFRSQSFIPGPWSWFGPNKVKKWGCNFLAWKMSMYFIYYIIYYICTYIFLIIICLLPTFFLISFGGGCGKIYDFMIIGALKWMISILVLAFAPAKPWTNPVLWNRYYCHQHRHHNRHSHDSFIIITIIHHPSYIIQDPSSIIIIIIIIIIIPIVSAMTIQKHSLPSASQSSWLKPPHSRSYLRWLRFPWFKVWNDDSKVVPKALLWYIMYLHI